MELVLWVREEVVHYDPDALGVFSLHFMVLMNVAIKSEHVEEHVDSQHLLIR